MADRKISDLTALTTPAAGDYLPIIDISEPLAANKNKRITIEELLRGAPDGTAGAPSFAFESDGGNGFYLAGTDTIGASTNGVNRLTLSTSALTSTVPISATSFTPTSSTVPTNGVYLPAANSVAISTNGTGRLFIDASGNVKVGTGGSTIGAFSVRTATNGNLHLRDINTLTAGTGVAIDILNDAATTVQDLAIRGATTIFRNASSETMRIDSSGRLGLGTSSPGATLHVEGLGNTVNQRIFTSDNVLNATASLTFGTTPGTRSKAALQMINVNTGNGAGALALQTNEGSTLATRLYIADTGRVGIGTTSPAGNCHILSASGSNTLYLSGGTVNSNGGGTAHITAAGPGGGWHNLKIRAYETIFENNGSEKARIDSSGRLGIGTSSPSTFGAQLAVIGGSVHADRNIGGAAAQVQFSMGASSGANFGQIGNTGTRWSLGYGTTANTIGTEVLVWNSSGNVGIGTTASPAGASIKLTLDGSSGGGIELVSNNNGGGALVPSAAGGIQFYTHTGAVGSESYSERARITSSGQLLVGTSTARNYSGYGIAGLQNEGTAFAKSSFGLTNNQDSADGVAIMLGKTRGTAVNSNTLVQVNDNLGVIHFEGADGSVLRIAATIAAQVDGTPGASDMPGRLVFSTTADGAASPTERMRIDSSGRVGLGTSTVNGLFHAAGSSPDIIIQDTQSYTVSDGPLIQFQGRGPNTTNYNFGYIRGVSSGSNNAGILQFATNSAGTQSVAMTIDSSQRVGIGTTGPTAPLCVQGAQNSAQLIVTGSNGLARGLKISTAVDYANDSLVTYDSQYASGSEYGAHAFLTGGQERLRIDRSGRLLVGTSSSTNASSNCKLVVNVNGASARLEGTLGYGLDTVYTTVPASGDDLGFFGFKAYTTGTTEAYGAWIMAEADSAWSSGSAPGRITFFTTADGASSPTERMRITSTGQVRLAGAGITFNGDTATANELDDYEEGTWTPALAFGGGSTAITYNARAGYYIKIGKQVFLTVYFNLSNKGTDTGSATITGLPFTSEDFNISGTTNWPGSIPSRRQNESSTSFAMMVADNTATIVCTNGAGAAVTDTTFTNGTIIECSLSYRAA